MKKRTLQVIFLLLPFLFSGCNNSDHLIVLDRIKPADEFARGFINKIFEGQTDSCFAEVNPDNFNEEFKTLIINASRNLKNAQVKNYRVVQENAAIGLWGGKFEDYSLGYEYELEGGNVLFTATITKKDGRFLIKEFNGQFLTAPLAVLTEFTLKNRSVRQYIFLVLAIIVPVFIFTTLIVMLFFSEISKKRKIAWAFIILLISMPRFIINWGTGEVEWQLFVFDIFGASMGRPALYSYWMISFSLPVGAILFWIRRRDLVLLSRPVYKEPEIDTTIPENSDIIVPNDVSANEEHPRE